jgi:DNA-binding transcriptional LysR family regulator
VELRDIEIFLTLAEELHFGRTAERLHVSQARVSQAIKKQERGVGASLFERTSRTVKLTTVGEQLRADLLPAYRNLREGMARARLAAEGKTGVLRIGMLPSNAHDLRPFWEAFRARHPHWGLHIRHNPYVNAFVPIRNGDIDVLVAWLPVEEPDLTVGPVIYTEPSVLVVAPDHELAAEKAVSLEVFADRGILQGPPGPTTGETRSHRSRRRAAGRSNAIRRTTQASTTCSPTSATVPASATWGAHVARHHARPDIVYLPIHDWGLRWGLVWRDDAETEMVRALADVVRDLGTATL